MRRREFYWSLYQSSTGKQLDDLRTDQVEAIFTVFNDYQRAEWMLWKEGLDQWQTLKNFPTLLAGLRKTPNEASVVMPPPKTGDAKPAVSASFESESEEGQGEGYEPLSLDEESAAEDRDNVRFKKRFDVRIPNGSVVHQNTTVDISMNGIRLKSDLPGGLPRMFNVEVQTGSTVFQLLCSAVPGDDGKPSNRLRIESMDQLNAFKSAIISNG